MHSTQVLQGHGLRDDFLVGHNLEVHLNKKDGINANALYSDFFLTQGLIELRTPVTPVSNT